MYIKVAAHMGNRKGFPENSMPAFESAYAIHADMIELDLRMTSDGEIVIMHDASLLRTTGIDRKVRDMTLEEITKIDIGSRTGAEFAGVCVPSLREFLELTKRDAKMEFNFEFKDYLKVEGEEFAKKSADKIISMISEYNLDGRYYLNSGDGGLLCYIDEKYGHKFRLHGFYPYSMLGGAYPKLYCACLFNTHLENGKLVWSREPLNPKEDFDSVISDGVRPWVGAGVTSDSDVLKAVEYGAELFTSNVPEDLMKFLKESGYRE